MLKGVPMRIMVLPFALGGLVLLPCWGCGGNPGAHAAVTIPVKGKVMFKGRPLTQGTVVFEPEDSGREAHGEVKPDGAFLLSTFKEGDGAVPGTHRVAVSGVGKVGKITFPVKYQNPSSSKTAVEVVEGKSEYEVDFK